MDRTLLSFISHLNIDWIYSWSMVTTFYLISLLTLSFIYVRKEKSRKKLEKQLGCTKLKPIPAPPRAPLIGNMYMLRHYQDNPWVGLNAIRLKYGDIVSLQMGIHHMVLLSSLNYMKEVLLNKAESFADRPNFSRYDIIFGGDKNHSLALCRWSDVHKIRRKFCKRAVVPSKLSDRGQLLWTTIRKHTNILMTELDKKANSSSTPTLDKTDILFLTGDIFLEFLCDEKYSHDNESYQKFNWNCDYVFYDINQSQPIDFLPYLTKFGLQRSYLRELKDITDFCRDFIDDNIFNPRYQKHKLGLDAKKVSNESPNNEKHDYLDSIILEHLSNETLMQLEDYKVGFADLLAGHSAVSNILMKLLGHLALDREAQDMIHEEAVKTKSAHLDVMPSLPVAEAALLEALRFATSPIVPHVAREDTSIGEYFVPKGTYVLFNYYNLNMSNDYWHEPHNFNIKRFLVETVDRATGSKSYRLNVPKYFNPFSIGLRQCLGFRMVESISWVAASNICEKFLLKCDDEELATKLLQPKGNVSLSPLEKCFKIFLEPRHS